jgi:hypothetical protein
MLKQAFDNGAIAALKRFGLEKTAVGFVPGMLGAARPFLRGQARALGDVGQGLGSMMSPNSTMHAPGRAQAFAGAKGLLPTAAIAGGGLLLSHLMGGGDQQQQQAPGGY